MGFKGQFRRNEENFREFYQKLNYVVTLRNFQNANEDV